MESRPTSPRRSAAVSPAARTASLLVCTVLAACGGGGGGDDRSCSPAPGFTSMPAPTATAGEEYRYLVHARHECGEWIPMVCNDFTVVAAPSGATSDGRVVVSWTPPLALAGTSARFVLRTVPDACGRSAEQAWSVRVLPDTTPPRVIRAWPAAGIPVSTLPEIGADLGERLDAATLTAESVVVSGTAGRVAGTLRVTAGGFAFLPDAPLPYASTISVTVRAPLADASGNPMTAPYTWSFTTEVGPPVPDTVPPSVPPAPSIVRASGATVTLAWSASTDDRAVAGYRLHRDGDPRQTVVAPSGTDTGLAFGTRYCWAVSAFDHAGNASAPSTPACGTTLDFAPGTVARWGYDFQGRLRTSPDVEPSLRDVAAVSPLAAALALKTDGTVWAVSDPPVQVAGVPRAAGVAGGEGPGVARASFALLTDGGVLGWGVNTYGQLGDGSTTDRQVPARVAGLSGVVAVSVGFGHTLVLLADGTVRAIGSNRSGQLGDGTDTSTTVPVEVAALSDVVAIAAAGDGSLALKRDGSVWGWGEHVYGVAGERITAAPVPIQGLSNVVAISRGRSFSLALAADGTVWAWGSNRSGELGDGTTIDRQVPARVTGLSDVVAVSAGAAHALALRRDGSVWAWGSNGSGELGDGTTVLRTVPAPVPGVVGVRAVAAAEQTSAALR